MTAELHKGSMYVEQDSEAFNNGGVRMNRDDDGHPKRTGTWVTASAHIIVAMNIGSGLLSLAWDMAQLGWIAGFGVLMAFSFITYFISTLLADCYESPDPVTRERNYTYMHAIAAHLGGRDAYVCGLAQFLNLVGITIDHTVTASINMMAVKRSSCFLHHGHHASSNPFMIIFACIQILLSQIPNFHKLPRLSILSATMCLASTSTGLGLSIAKVAGRGHHARTSLTGVRVGVDVSGSDKVWRTFQAIGDIASAYAYSTVHLEIQDTLKSTPPENKMMKRASGIGILTTTTFYVLCGCFGYAAFGNDAPKNFLSGFGLFEPSWLIDFANVCIVIHLIVAYQLSCQPLFQIFESRCSEKWRENKFITGEHEIRILFFGAYHFNFFRLVWRTAYVIVTVVVTMIFPFLNDFVGLIRAASFWLLTVYFPIEMHIAQTKMKKYSFTWIWLKALSWACMMVSLVAAAGSVEGLVQSLKVYKPFQSRQ
ncbi:hypothetical protein SLE2022_324560 [Rubroshorea leprosula]